MISNDQQVAQDIVDAVMMLQHVDELQLVTDMLENLDKGSMDKLAQRFKNDYDLYTLDEARDELADEDADPDDPVRDESRE
jgi:hypothetical protein